MKLPLIALALCIVSNSTFAAETTLINRDIFGNHASSAFDSSMSADGRIIVFSSTAVDLLTQGLDKNGESDVFAVDTASGTTSLISVNSNGEQANAFSGVPSISADGRYVAFVSFADNWGAATSDGLGNVFVHDRSTGITTLVSASLNGLPGSGDSASPSISDDGRYIVFASDADNLVIGDSNDAMDIFLFDRVNETVKRISVSSSGDQGNGTSFRAVISGDGQVVAFTSRASNLLTHADDNNRVDVFKHDIVTGSTTLVSGFLALVPGPGGIPSLTIVSGEQSSGSPAINIDGSVVAFATSATNLHGGQTDREHIMLKRDGVNGLQLISQSEDGAAGNDDSREPNISGDARYVHFSSKASNFIQDDINEVFDEFLVDTENGQVELLSRDSFGNKVTSTGFDFFNGAAGQRQISADGRLVVFDTFLSKLVEDDSDTGSDVFLRNRGEQCLPDTPGATNVLVNNQWQLASLPCSPPIGKDTVQDLFADDIDGVLGVDWAVFTYNATLPIPAYEPALLSTMLKSGQGFWIIQDTGAKVTLDLPEGSQVVTARRSLPEQACVSDIGCFELALTGAENADFIWNMIGNPYPASIPVAFDDLRVTTSVGVCAASPGCTMSEAASGAALIVNNQFFRYTDGAYESRDAGSTFAAWEGLWVPELILAEDNSPTIRFPR